MAGEQHHDSGGTELGRFLRARRVQVTPADVGFTPSTGLRRTPGLRRAGVAALAGTDSDAPDLAALVGELLLKSPEFAKLWERYDVTQRGAARTKTFHHPQVGTITLSFQGMQLENTPGHRLGVYVAEPGTPDYDAMILLDMTAPSRTEKPAAHRQR